MNNRHLTNPRTSLFLFLYIWVMYAIVCMTKNCFSGAMATIVDNGIMTKSQTGLITAMFYIAYAPLQVVGGKLADRYRPDIIILIGLFGAALANLVIWLNQNYYVMLLTWTLNAVFQFGIWPAIFKIISSHLEPNHRAKGIYYIGFASNFGLCFAFIGGAFMHNWQDNFLLSAVLLFLLGIGFGICYPLSARKMVPDEDPALKAPAGKLHTPAAPKGDSHTLFARCGLYILLPAVIIRGLLEYIKNFAPTLLMESYEQITPLAGNLINVIIICAGFVGSFVVKLLFPRHFSDELQGLRTMFLIILPCLFFTLLVGKVASVFVVIAIAVTVALASGMWLLTSYFTMKFAPYGKNGEVAGIMNSGAAVGIVIQSYGIALIADLYSWNAVLWLLIGLTLLAVVLVSAAMPKWHKFSQGGSINGKRHQPHR